MVTATMESARTALGAARMTKSTAANAEYFVAFMFLAPKTLVS
jgi:hypothetical protein